MKKNRTEKKKTSKLPSLVLPSKNGEILWSFSDPVVESIRHLLTQFERKGGIPARLSLMAALRGEGVTYSAWAFATTLVNDFPVSACVVDLNWWYPSTVVSKPDNLGITDILINDASIDDVLITTGWPNLSYMPAGKKPTQNHPVTPRNPALKGLLSTLASRFDHLILDIPAYRATNDSVILASLADTVCIIIHQGVTHIDDVHSMLDDIDHLKIAGVVMNQARFTTPAWIIKRLLQPL
jgi:Mrp family chromosome partitioning ATPase